jgi:N-acetylneuraminic acid mutarotase
MASKAHSQGHTVAELGEAITKHRRVISPVHAMQTAACAVLRPGLLMMLACLCPSGDAETNQWTWMGGSSTLGATGGQPGLYGTLGVPAVGNTPGGRDGAASWTGSNGQFWLFGGRGYDANGTLGYLNDLWEFNPSNNEWTWISGSDTAGGHGGQPGVYGALGQPAAGNTPGSRNGAATWTDSSGNLWLFGGWTYDSDGIAGELNDLWEFNPSNNEWTWMGGSTRVGPLDGQSGVYGTLGTAAIGNTPGGLYAPSSWVDANGDLWLFAGQGNDGNGNFHELNGLWEFNAATAEWAWMGGSKTVGNDGDVPGVYGTLGTPAAGNIPGNRSEASSWIGNTGGLWIFGGTGYDADGNGGYLNDLWAFQPAENEWAWTSGSSTVGGNGGQSGVYGALGTLAAGNGPGGRSGATSWTDATGNLWLLGGDGFDAGGNGGYLNDLWEFDLAANLWGWASGSSKVGSNGGQSGVYGTLGLSAAGNVPGGRDAANGWTDGAGNLWLFGGYGYDSGGNYGYLNDLWKYSPSTGSLTAATPTFSPPAGTYTAVQTVTISDATAGAIIYYTTNGTAPTASSTVYAGTITVASTETLEAIATFAGHSNSAVATAAYIINLPATTATPTFSPPAGTYAATQTVTISDATANAIIYYTTNGTAPTASSTVYAGAINVASTETLEAIATANGHPTSAVATAAYIVNLPAATATPTFSPPAGTYAAAQTVTISDATTSAIIYYTTNGTTPTASSNVYAGTINVASTETLEAIATATGNSTSAVATAAYIINLPAATATPTFSPPAGIYAAAQTVTISDGTTGAIIYYTTNGTTPTASSTVYSGAINVASTETLEAIATAAGHSTSAAAAATYTIGVPALAFNITGTAVTISPGAETGNASIISIAPSGGFTGAVALTVAITAGPTGAQDTPTFSFGSTSPAEISGVGAATSTLTVFSTPASSAAVTNPARTREHGYFLGASALACLLLFLVPRRRRSMTMLGMAALFATLACGAVACGSTIHRTVVTNIPGTTPGAYTLTVTGTSGAITETGTVTLNVQ